MRRIRVRGYFGWMAFRHIALGAIWWRSAAQLELSPSMQFIPGRVWWWCLAMIVVGILCAGGVFRPRQKPMRWICWLSMVFTLWIVFCLVSALVFGEAVVGGYAVLLSAIAGKDYLMLGLPWVDPFENVSLLPEENIVGVP